MSNNKLSKRDGIKTLIENNKSRLSLTNEEELSIWGDSVKKLVDLGEFILNHLADITDDEIESYWNLSKMAESIHNTLRGDELRKKDAAIFAATLEQTINYYKLFYNQIIDAHRLPAREYEKERLLIQEEINKLAMDLTILPIRYIFAKKDLKQNPYIRESIGPVKSTTGLKNYEFYYSQIKDLYHEIEDEIRTFATLVEKRVNKDIPKEDLDTIKQEIFCHRYLTNLFLECLKSKDLKTLRKDKLKLEYFLRERQSMTESLKEKEYSILK